MTYQIKKYNIETSAKFRTSQKQEVRLNQDLSEVSVQVPVACLKTMSKMKDEIRSFSEVPIYYILLNWQYVEKISRNTSSTSRSYPSILNGILPLSKRKDGYKYDFEKIHRYSLRLRLSLAKA